VPARAVLARAAILFCACAREDGRVVFGKVTNMDLLKFLMQSHNQRIRLRERRKQLEGWPWANPQRQRAANPPRAGGQKQEHLCNLRRW